MYLLDLFINFEKKVMIRSIPNPPMDKEDIARFRSQLEKHLRGNLSPEEQQQAEHRRERAKENVKRILANCGGKNPILGY